MPDWLASILPGVLSGVASGLIALGAIRETVKGLMERVTQQERNIMRMVRALGRIEGRLCIEPKEEEEV